jgi:hypothetical protein
MTTNNDAQEKKLKTVNLGAGAAIFTLDTFDIGVTDKFITCHLKIKADEGYGVMVSISAYVTLHNSRRVL